MMCYGWDVNERHVGIHAKFLVLFTACIKLAGIVPLHLLLFVLVRGKWMALHFYGLFSGIATILYFPWSVYLVIRFFSDDNHTKDEAGFLYAALLYLMIEGMILIAMVLCMTFLIVTVWILLCYLHRNRMAERQQQQERNTQISGLINQLDVLNLTGRRYSQNEIWWICLENFGSDGSNMIQLPWAGQHLFHKDCIVEWIQHNNTCPICKTEITEEILREVQENPDMFEDKPENNYGGMENGTAELEGINQNTNSRDITPLEESKLIE